MQGDTMRTDDIVNMSIAEMNLAEQIAKILSTISQESKRLEEIVKSFADKNMEGVKRGYEYVRHLKNDAQKTKEETMEYVVRLSPTLVTKELYIFSLANLDRISQLIDSIAYRLSILAYSNATVGDELKDQFVSFSFASLSMVEKLYNEAKYLSSNPRKVGEIHMEINRIEEDVDQMYRELELEIIKMFSKDVFSLMIVKEIVDLIEELADKIRDASYDFKYLALYKS